MAAGTFWSRLLGAGAATPADALARRGLEVVQDEAGFVVTGRTFRHRALLKQAGGEWLEATKAWRFADTGQLAALAALLDSPAAAGLAESAAPWRPKAPTSHRERQIEGFLEHGADALDDEDLLELLLFFAVARRDTRPLAAALVARFGDLAGVLGAPPADLAQVLEFDPNGNERTQALALFGLVRSVGLRAQAERFQARPLIDDPEALARYLDARLGHEPVEAFHALFLDAGNRLIRDVRMQKGTVDHTPLYPRELAKRALETNAVAVILVHNHPSGDPTPSPEDVATTRQVVEALAAINVTVYDHFVIGQGRQVSFRAAGLL